MGKLLTGAIIGGLSVYAYHRLHLPESTLPVQEYAPRAAQAPESPESLSAVEAGNSTFHCDGRTHCSQMTSCEEAIYFLQNCPGVKMDGEGDGIPCESQWCDHQ